MVFHSLYFDVLYFNQVCLSLSPIQGVEYIDETEEGTGRHQGPVDVRTVEFNFLDNKVSANIEFVKECSLKTLFSNILYASLSEHLLRAVRRNCPL